MKKIAILITLFAAVLITAGCSDQEKLTSSYFMQHPKLLKEEVAHCQSLDEKTADEASFCDIVMAAATSFMSIVDEQQSAPEKFGQKILTAEYACSQAHDALNQAKQTLAMLQENRVTGATLSAAEDKLKQAQSAYDASLEQVKIMMAVMSLSSPE